MILHLMTTLSLAAPVNADATTEQSIPAIASSSERLETLVAAVTAAELVGALSGEGPFTVFAPTDEAFGRLPEGTIESLLEEPGKKTLTRILTHHVIPGRYEASDLVGMDSIETLAGTSLTLASLKGRLLVEESIVESANIGASNGVVHIIDRVLLPPVEVDPLEVLLEQAIDRGVPLFNDGNIEACCAVYSTALDAVIIGDSWGLCSDRTKELAESVSEVALDKDERSRAWAYRRIIDSLLRERRRDSGDHSNSSASSNAVFTFEDSSEIRGWRTVLDGVMGGLSTGEIDLRNDSLVFTGETSLRNNGGFSSIRCELPQGAFAEADAIKMRVRGDGRKWIVGTRKGTQMGGDSYWTRFNTEDGEWQTLTIPIKDMERHFFGQRLSGRITPEEVRGLEFYMYDKKAGPFSLEIDSIEGVKVNA
ncbi:MAG: CIA30 family protein [Planctomycetes bacterium]|nr:CIA30 family protein [Planctomycetota bacterium]